MVIPRAGMMQELDCERQITVVNELAERTGGDLFGLQIETAKTKWKVESYGTGAGSKVSYLPLSPHPKGQNLTKTKATVVKGLASQIWDLNEKLYWPYHSPIMM
jgi:hypothetical protein